MIESRIEPCPKLSCFVRRTFEVGMVVGLTMLAGGAAQAAPKGRLTTVSPGKSPFASCTADRVRKQIGTNYPNTAIEPWIDANPAKPDNLIAGWQQDRWSNGGSRGLVAGYSKDGGRTWRRSVPPGVTVCSGGQYVRASDPWVSISPDGTAYFMSLAFDEDRPDGGLGANAMLVSRSKDGGVTWGKPISLIKDTSGQILNDKNSMTADPTNSAYAYAVWDRLRDFTLPTSAEAATAGAVAERMDGVTAARERVRWLKAAAAASGTAALAPEALPAPASVTFEGPIWFARTINGGDSWQKAKKIYDPGPDAQTIGNQIVVQPGGTLVDFFTHIFSNGLVRLDLIRSYDKGRTFQSRPRFVDAMLTAGVVTPDLEEGVRDASILFDVAVDPNSGALYAVWQDLRFRGIDEVAFSQSTDGGASWTKAIRVNQTPRSRNVLREQAFLPAIAVGPRGELIVTYYDFRNDNAKGELTDYWSVTCKADCASRSSWGGELRLTDKPFNMLDAPFAGGHFLGDYMGLVVARKTVHPLFGIATGPDLTTDVTRRVGLN